MQTKQKRMTLAEYLAYDDGTDTRYELVNGELTPMPPEHDLNRRIAFLLVAYFLKQGIPFSCLSNKTEIVVIGNRATTRCPDLTLLTEDLVTALEGTNRSTILADMPAPRLVIEVASPGPENADRDYRYKRSEYAARGIAEYWVVDPHQQKVTIFELVAGFYEERTFAGSDVLQSPSFGNLTLTVEKLLRAEM